jgi:predicted amidohydrolase
VRADSANDPVRVAACQVSLAIGEVARNRSAALEAAGLAADRGAAIIVLPELTPSGYVFRDAAEARSLAEPADGPTARRRAAGPGSPGSAAW